MSWPIYSTSTLMIFDDGKVGEMLLDAEKDGDGPRRLTRSVAFLEAANEIDRLAGLPHVTKTAYREMISAANLLRQKSLDERAAWDRELARIELTKIAQGRRAG